jgi:hypothetical protein
LTLNITINGAEDCTKKAAEKRGKNNTQPLWQGARRRPNESTSQKKRTEPNHIVPFKFMYVIHSFFIHVLLQFKYGMGICE